jgi:hypothetical protein
VLAEQIKRNVVRAGDTRGLEFAGRSHIDQAGRAGECSRSRSSVEVMVAAAGVFMTSFRWGRWRSEARPTTSATSSAARAARRA